MDPSLLKNYMTLTKASVGSKIFKNLYFKKKNKNVDILKNGDLSCAFFVSSILKIFNLVNNIHTTVNGLEKDLEKNNWEIIKKPKPGSVIIWNVKNRKNGAGKHIGIYIGDNKAISNSSKKKSPQINKFDYYPIEKILWNKRIK